MKIGYARVSGHEQKVDLQIDALNGAGAERIFVDEGVSGAKASRPEWDKCLAQLRDGDELVLWRLDRCARSLRNLLELVENLTDRGVSFRSLTEQIDTGSASGRLVLSVFGALGEFERDLLRERTTAGLAAAKARGVRVGRPSSLSPTAVEQARALVAAGHRVSEVAQTLGVGRSTLYRVLESVG